MVRRRIVVLFLLAFICGGGAISLELTRPGFFRQAEAWMRDSIMRNGRMTPANPDLIFLAIDNASVTLDPQLDVDLLFSSNNAPSESRRALELMASGWPWSREVYALIIERLVNAGAKVVALDCFFAEPGHGDDSLRAVLNRDRDHVVIGSNFVTSDDVDLTRPLPSRYDLPTTSVLQRDHVPDDRVGFTNFFADQTRIVRAAQYRIAFREAGHTTETYLSLGARMAEKSGAAPKIPNDFAEHLIRFTGPPGIGFRARPAYEIFAPEYWTNNYRSGEFFRGKSVIVGAEGSWQKDALMTPLGLMAGAELHLNAVNALLHGELINELSMPDGLVVIFCATALAIILNLRSQSPWMRLSILCLTSASFVGMAVCLYNYANAFVPMTAPLLALNATVLLGFASDFAFERIEKLGLRSTLKTRDDLTHMIVHDLRSPLTIMTGYAGVLQQIAAEKLGEDEAQCVSEMLRGTDDMRDLVTNLLDLGRLESGEMPLRMEDVDLTELVRTLVRRFETVAGERKLQADTPNEPLVIQCDGDVVRRVLANFLTNAIKYTQPDGNILVELELRGDSAIVRVNDDGAGIPASQHEHVFEKFGQTKSGAQHRHSSGIGLAFCRMAVEAHGGKVGLTSDVGRGSTFWFKLPAQVAAPLPNARA